MSKPEVYKRRLLKLAAFLFKLPPNRFNYHRWVGHGWGGKANLSCGTTACAFGWSTTFPSFRKLGLRLFNDGGFGVVALKEDEHNVGNKHVDQMDLTCKAANRIFGLTEDETFYLFVPSNQRDYRAYEGPFAGASAKQVAEHIIEFVKEKYN